ncbi:cytochrome P450 family protein (plasmid) [Streptomyces sp. BI20]|uniref:cytochrome P450 family protein n=1 Tax=Streptomyces sp. BI20 TaxID=3403460 RepID=UPI003C74D795
MSGSPLPAPGSAPDGPRAAAPAEVAFALDLTGSALYSDLDRLRDAAPAVPVNLPDGIVAWSVTRGDVVRRLTTHPEVSKNGRAHWPGYRLFSIPWLALWVDPDSMLTNDGLDHQRLRALVDHAFTPRRITAMRPGVEAVVRATLDAPRRAADADGVVDLRAAFCAPVPTRVICELFGMSQERSPVMVRAIDGLLDSTAPAEEVGRHRETMYAETRALIAAKREAPGEDMTSVLLAAQAEGGDRLDEGELISTLFLMIGAGSETTVSLLEHAVAELLARPELLASVRADPRLWDVVIEETLRKHPPAVHVPMRFALADIDLGEGVTIRAGDPILIGFGAHGRDPGTNPDPSLFDLDRSDRQHLSFGFGAHYCLGAPLARLEARIALPALFERYPGMSLAVKPAELRRLPSFIVNGHRELPVRLG